jgi:hypothetical protein
LYAVGIFGSRQLHTQGLYLLAYQLIIQTNQHLPFSYRLALLYIQAFYHAALPVRWCHVRNIGGIYFALQVNKMFKILRIYMATATSFGFATTVVSSFAICFSSTVICSVIFACSTLSFCSSAFLSFRFAASSFLLLPQEEAIKEREQNLLHTFSWCLFLAWSF